MSFVRGLTGLGLGMLLVLPVPPGTPSLVNTKPALAGPLPCSVSASAPAAG